MDPAIPVDSVINSVPLLPQALRWPTLISSRPTVTHHPVICKPHFIGLYDRVILRNPQPYCLLTSPLPRIQRDLWHRAEQVYSLTDFLVQWRKTFWMGFYKKFHYDVTEKIVFLYIYIS